MHAVLVVASLLLAPVLAPADPTSQEDFPGCNVEAARATCAWTFRAFGDPTQLGGFGPEFALPVFEGTIATLRVRATVADRTVSGPYNWEAGLWISGPDGERRLGVHSGDGRASWTDTTTVGTLHFVFSHEPRTTYWLKFERGTPGDYAVAYEAAPVPPGEAPARPAATKEEPHLRGAAGDAADPNLDLVAAWLTDDLLGDGLFEARIALTDFARPTMGGSPYQWNIDWTLGERRYHVVWQMGGFAEWCTLGVYPTDDDTYRGQARLAWLDCAIEEGPVLRMRMPEAALGNPSAGVEFTDFTAYTRYYATANEQLLMGQLSQNSGSEVDRIDQTRFAFALGGPAVWDGLNACAFCAPTPAWMEAPFSEEHLANTLQVVGAIAAALAFVGGIAVVRHRRARVKRLFDEVDAIARAHDADARAGLLALGALESDLDARYRAGRIHENEYQLVSQRIATVATRLSLRRHLGLDDGAPGDEPAVTLRREG